MKQCAVLYGGPGRAAAGRAPIVHLRLTPQWELAGWLTGGKEGQRSSTLANQQEQAGQAIHGSLASPWHEATRGALHVRWTRHDLRGVGGGGGGGNHQPRSRSRDRAKETESGTQIYQIDLKSLAGKTCRILSMSSPNQTVVGMLFFGLRNKGRDVGSNPRPTPSPQRKDAKANPLNRGRDYSPSPPPTFHARERRKYTR